MNTTLEDIDDEPQPHQREPSVGSYTYSIGIFFGALIILIAISYSYYYIIARLKPTDDNSRNTPPIRSHHHHHHHRRQRSNRSPMSITSSDYDSESEITSHGIDEATITDRYPMLLFSELVVSHKSGYCGGGGGGSGCSICLQDYEGKDSVRLLPECGHFFHAQCVDAWLRIHPNCPICRKSLIVTPPVDNPPAAAVAAAMSVQ